MYPYELFLGVNLYGIMVAVGILCCFGVLYLYSKAKGLDGRFTDFVFYNGVFSIAVGFFFAALFQGFYNYLENPKNGFSLSGGITFIGGLIGGASCFLIVYFIFRKHTHGKLTDILALAPCCILIAHAFGRLGCLFAGCCHGAYLGQDPVSGGILMDPPSAIKGYYVPIQLYEAIFLFVVFAICSYLLLKKDFKHNLSVYLISYGIFRFIVEYFRTDNRGQFIGSLSPSQFWSIVMVVIGVALIFLLNYVFKKRKLNHSN